MPDQQRAGTVHQTDRPHGLRRYLTPEAIDKLLRRSTLLHRFGLGLLVLAVICLVFDVLPSLEGGSLDGTYAIKHLIILFRPIIALLILSALCFWRPSWGWLILCGFGLWGILLSLNLVYLVVIGDFVIAQAGSSHLTAIVGVVMLPIVVKSKNLYGSQAASHQDLLEAF